MRLAKNGVNIIATNRSLSDHPVVVKELFGAEIKKLNHDGAGFYLNPDK
jgi:hypothetical protein